MHQDRCLDAKATMNEDGSMQAWLGRPGLIGTFVGTLN